MNVGLDVGTSTIILALEGKDGLEFVKVRNCFIDLPATTIIKNTLDNLKTNYIEDIELKKIYLIGDDALSLANMFGKEARRPMFKGVISNKDADAIPIMKAIFEMLFVTVPRDAKISYTIPAEPINDSFDVEYHKNVIETILAGLGFSNFKAVNEAMCVAYAELEDKQFSGIAASYGAGMINLSVSQFGIEALSFALQGSGDQIDEKVAKTQAKLTASKVTALKEAGIDIIKPTTRVEEAIAVYYKALIKNSLKLVLDKMTSLEALTLKDDIAIAIAGGTSKVGGFKELFLQTLEELAPEYSFTYGDVKFPSDDPQFTIAKGACVASKLS